MKCIRFVALMLSLTTAVISQSQSAIHRPVAGNGRGVPSKPSHPPQQLQFTGSTYTLNTVPFFVTTADLNGDGFVDIIVGSQVSTSFDILFGNGDGTFQPPVSYSANYPKSIAVGDFNRDGRPDLAVVELGAIAVFFNQGNGSFGNPVFLSLSAPASSVISGDFNNDGKLDLAYASYNNNTVNILLGNGDGTFQPSVSFPTGFAPEDIVAGDFNKDGNLDLANTDEFQSSTVNYPTNMSVLLGNGDGTFQPVTNYTVGNFPFGMALADFNHDGNLDAAVTDVSGYVGIFLGEGNGGFGNFVSYGAYTGTEWVTVGDFNLDGKLDLATANDEGNVSILLGNGDGTFQGPVDFPAGKNTTGIATADFNRDGYLDLVATNESDGTITVLLNSTSPSVLLSSASLKFGNQVIGTASGAQSMTLTNSGIVPLTISSLHIVGTNGSDFLESNNCGSSLAGGASCAINVTFDPVTIGYLTGAISIADNAPNSPQTVLLSGSGTDVQLAPSALRFGSQQVGTTSISKKITLTNKGNMTLNVASISLAGVDAGDFAESNTCGKRLVAGASCYVSVTFSPSAKGTRTAAISVSDSGGGSPQQVPLSGSGT